jgi:uncharacterized protein YicC (UPF0701 family)
MSNAPATGLRTIQADLEESEAEQTKLRWYQTITTDSFALRVLGEELERLDKHIEQLRNQLGEETK